VVLVAGPPTGFMALNSVVVKLEPEVLSTTTFPF
jgi:hypothetical protein